MKAPERTTADAFPTYIGGQVIADSATLKWPGLFVRRYLFPRVVDGFLVPATAEPLIAGILAGSAEFEKREAGGTWLPHRVRRGDLFFDSIANSLRIVLASPSGAELGLMHIHLGLDQCRAAFETVYRDKASAVELIEFFGQDETLAHLSFACVKILSARNAGSSQRVAAIARLLISSLFRLTSSLAPPAKFVSLAAIRSTSSLLQSLCTA
jgi:hypothetical protein